MDNQEMFLRIPGILKGDTFRDSSNMAILVIHGRKELVAQMGASAKYIWDIKPRYFIFPDMQEVCETEVTLIVKDE